MDSADQMQGCSSSGGVRNFVYSWLSNKKFSPWLVNRDNQAFCNACKRVLSNRKNVLEKHVKSESHLWVMDNNYSSVENNDAPTSFCSSEENLNISDLVKSAEIKLASYFAEHNVSIQSVDHLVDLIKVTFTRPEIVEQIKLHRTKCSKIITNVLEKREMERTSDALRNNYFSILLDESTDITDKKCLSIVVQYFSTEMNNVITELFKIIELDATDCSAEKLFAAFKNCFFQYGIPFENIVGFACDNASVMLGSRDSFLARLKEIVPRVILLNCICHTSAIVAKKACKELPQECFELMRGVATYVSGSAKRCAILKEFQTFCEVETHKILKIGETRWLSTQKCVDRLIENWSCLRLFFTDACFNDKLESATKILDLLNSDTIKCYFLFLNYALTAFNKFNAFFQSRNVLIHKLVKTSKTLIKQFGQNFLKAEALSEIECLNLHDLKYYLDIDLIYLGSDCEEFLENLSEEDVLEIRKRCLNFYKVSVIEMQQRLPLNSIIFKKLEFLDPVIALDITVRNREIRDFNCILPSLPPIFNKNELAMEWRQLPLIEDSDREMLQGLDIVPFWNKVFTLKNFDNNKLFPNLELLLKMLLSLPHSNAEVERIFSIVTDVRSKKRNAIGADLLNAICKIRSSFQAHEKNCVSFQFHFIDYIFVIFLKKYTAFYAKCIFSLKSVTKCWIARPCRCCSGEEANYKNHFAHARDYAKSGSSGLSKAEVRWVLIKDPSI
ncbi:zinc finger protein 862-like [Prorops nasuta]|uniref:zinc finger protein 862-like n=1 Tax=Prorops nasuta TaxID=863751 RepID=UPI0034CD20DA